MFYKNFCAYIGINAYFFKSQYADYYKYEITEWIKALSKVFIENLHIEIGPPNFTNDTIKYYTFDTKNDNVIDFNQIWLPKMSYAIYISGSGLLPFGIYQKEIEPPKNILEEIVHTVTFKYIEQCDNKPISMYVFGPDLYFPTTFDDSNTDIEEWEPVIKNYSLISYCWNLSLYCSGKNFLKILNIFNQLKTKINRLQHFEIETDWDGNEEIGYISAHGHFHLPKEYRRQYMFLLNEINKYILDDDNCYIDNINIFFRSLEPKSFYVETCLFDEYKGMLLPKSIEV